jgi:membrane protease YdiL (CAAX protease family)
MGQLGRVSNLAIDIPHPEGGTAPRAAVKKQDHRLILHWLPWVLPLLAIALPMLGFVVAASIPVFALRWGETSTALGRGDFLIPVLILCLEAIRHWWAEVKCGWRMGTVRVFFSALCLGAVIICSDSFSVASSHAVTPASTKSVTMITLACFTIGLLAGTMAVLASTPKAGT